MGVSIEIDRADQHRKNEAERGARIERSLLIAYAASLTGAAGLIIAAL
jgi:hypothetical protein